MCPRTRTVLRRRVCSALRKALAATGIPIGLNWAATKVEGKITYKNCETMHKKRIGTLDVLRRYVLSFEGYNIVATRLVRETTQSSRRRRSTSDTNVTLRRSVWTPLTLHASYTRIMNRFVLKILKLETYLHVKWLDGSIIPVLYSRVKLKPCPYLPFRSYSRVLRGVAVFYAAEPGVGSVGRPALRWQ